MLISKHDLPPGWEIGSKFGVPCYLVFLDLSMIMLAEVSVAEDRWQLKSRPNSIYLPNRQLTAWKDMGIFDTPQAAIMAYEMMKSV